MAATGQAAEVLETDAAIAQALLDAGEPLAAAQLAEEAAARADSLGAGYLMPSLLRVRGAGLAASGQLADAEAVLAAALDSCEAQGQLERGFILVELSRVATALGNDAEAAARLSAESAQALDALGFVGSPRYPRA